MQTPIERTPPWEHDHLFGQDQVRPGEKRTKIVVAVTAVTMVAEIAAGIAFGSMALLADGLHMGSHAAALALNVFAYWFARRHAGDPRFSFGTGKVNALGGYTGAVLLAGFALVMAWESVDRFIHPVEIQFGWAIAVACVGLVINGGSMLILGHDHDHDHGHGAEAGHEHHDHNLRSAYLHVLADALTSVLAIVALVTAKLVGWVWLDPLMGIVGAVLVTNWSWGLVRQSARVLLDREAPERLRQRVRARLEEEAGTEVTDLHLWSIGPGIWAAEVALVSSGPRPVAAYRAQITDEPGIVHLTVEVHERPTP